MVPSWGVLRGLPVAWILGAPQGLHCTWSRGAACRGPRRARWSPRSSPGEEGGQSDTSSPRMSCRERVWKANSSVWSLPGHSVTYMWVGYSLDRQGGRQGVLYGAGRGRGVGPQDHRVLRARALGGRVPEHEAWNERRTYRGPTLRALEEDFLFYPFSLGEDGWNFGGNCKWS